MTKTWTVWNKLINYYINIQKSKFSLRLSQYLLELSCCEEFQGKQVLATCPNEESLETPGKNIF